MVPTGKRPRSPGEPASPPAKPTPSSLSSPSESALPPLPSTSGSPPPPSPSQLAPQCGVPTPRLLRLVATKYQPPQDHTKEDFAVRFIQRSGVVAKRSNIFDGTYFELFLTGGNILMPPRSTRIFNTQMRIQLPARVFLHLGCDARSKIDVETYVHGNPEFNSTARVRLRLRNGTDAPVTLKEGDLLGRGGFARMPQPPRCNGIFVSDEQVDDNNPDPLENIQSMEDGDIEPTPTPSEGLRRLLPIGHPI